jgi:hypothetical protein
VISGRWIGRGGAAEGLRLGGGHPAALRARISTICGRADQISSTGTPSRSYSSPTLVFDDPSLGTVTGHGVGSDHFVATPSGTIAHEIFNSKEGRVQIIEHFPVPHRRRRQRHRRRYVQSGLSAAEADGHRDRDRVKDAALLRPIPARAETSATLRANSRQPYRDGFIGP